MKLSYPLLFLKDQYVWTKKNDEQKLTPMARSKVPIFLFYNTVPALIESCFLISKGVSTPANDKECRSLRVSYRVLHVINNQNYQKPHTGINHAFTKLKVRECLNSCFSLLSSENFSSVNHWLPFKKMDCVELFWKVGMYYLFRSNR